MSLELVVELRNCSPIGSCEPRPHAAGAACLLAACVCTRPRPLLACLHPWSNLLLACWRCRRLGSGADEGSPAISGGAAASGGRSLAISGGAAASGGSPGGAIDAGSEGDSEARVPLRLRQEAEAAAAEQEEEAGNCPLPPWEEACPSCSNDSGSELEEQGGGQRDSAEVAFFRERLDERLYSPPLAARLPEGWDVASWCRLTLRQFIYVVLAEKQSGTLRDNSLDRILRLLRFEILPQPNLCPPSLYICLKVRTDLCPCAWACTACQHAAAAGCTERLGQAHSAQSPRCIPSQLVNLESLDAYEHHVCECGHVWPPQPKAECGADDHCPVCEALDKPITRRRFKEATGNKKHLVPMNVSLTRAAARRCVPLRAATASLLAILTAFAHAPASQHTHAPPPPVHSSVSGCWAASVCWTWPSATPTGWMAGGRASTWTTWQRHTALQLPASQPTYLPAAWP